MVCMTATQIKASMRAKAQRNANAVYRANVARKHVRSDSHVPRAYRTSWLRAEFVVGCMCLSAVALAFILAH